jgi:hypothetical protein
MFNLLEIYNQWIKFVNSSVKFSHFSRQFQTFLNIHQQLEGLVCVSLIFITFSKLVCLLYSSNIIGVSIETKFLYFIRKKWQLVDEL